MKNNHIKTQLREHPHQYGILKYDLKVDDGNLEQGGRVEIDIKPRHGIKGITAT